MAEILGVNRLIRLAKAHATLELAFPSSLSFEKARFGVFSDAAWANRGDGSSQGGRVLNVADKDFWQGTAGPFALVGRRSGKCQRMCRSSLL